MQSVAVMQPPMPRRTVNGQKVYILSLVAMAEQGGAMLLESDAAKWLSKDVRRFVLALDTIGFDDAVDDHFADLELAAVDVLRLRVAQRVVGEVDCDEVVPAQLSRTWRREARFNHQ
eukprot:6191585-Pleurochrysis_carterae.AAC.4